MRAPSPKITAGTIVDMLIRPAAAKRELCRMEVEIAIRAVIFAGQQPKARQLRQIAGKLRTAAAALTALDGIDPLLVSDELRQKLTSTAAT